MPEKNAYLLPITSVNGNYSPRVMQIRREGSTKRVTVGYLDLYGSGEIVFDPTNWNRRNIWIISLREAATRIT